MNECDETQIPHTKSFTQLKLSNYNVGSVHRLRPSYGRIRLVASFDWTLDDAMPIFTLNYHVHGSFACDCVAFDECRRMRTNSSAWPNILT